MATPAHAASGPTRVQQLRRWGFIVLGVDFAVATAFGIYLTYRYEPGGGGSSTIHAVLGVVAVGAALVAAGATVADEERSTIGIIPAVVLLAVVAGIYLTGPALKYDQAARASGPVTRGVTFGFHSDALPVRHDNKVLKPDQYRRYLWLHLIALPVAVVSMGGAGIVVARRRRSTYVPQRLAEPDVSERD